MSIVTRPSLTPSGGKALWVCLIDDHWPLNPSFELEFELEVDANNMLDKDSVGRALGFKNGAELYCKRGPSRQDPFGGRAKHPMDTECTTSVENLSFHSEHGWGSIEQQYIRLSKKFVSVHSGGLRLINVSYPLALFPTS